jgi:uncharacterized protein (TIGR03083 family)
MILSPSYEGPVRLMIDDDGSDHLTAIARQHRRLARIFTRLGAGDWTIPSRCEGWTVRDVAAHLVGVNRFWVASIQAGLTGHPTKLLDHFDPVVTPPFLVRAMGDLSGEQVLKEFVSASAALLDVLADLDETGWSTPAESPVGHVPIRLVVHHALWDSWVHERDIAIPLGLDVANQTDEVSMCLRYVAALGPALAFAVGRPISGRFAIDATDPDLRFVVDVAESITVRSAATMDGAVCLRGDAAELTEALSLRAPLPPDTPEDFQQLLDGLRTAFNAH